MAKGVGQSGAWAISIMISLLLFAAIIALVLNIRETRNDSRIDLSNQSLDEEIYREQPGTTNAETTKSSDAPKEAPEPNEDGEYEIKADDTRVAPKKKQLYGLTGVTMGLKIGPI